MLGVILQVKDCALPLGFSDAAGIHSTALHQAPESSTYYTHPPCCLFNRELGSHLRGAKY